MEIQSSFDAANQVVVDIATHVMPSFEIKGEMRQFKTSIHLYIANAMYRRDKEIREKERLDTLIVLAKILPNEHLYHAIESLGIRIVICKEDL
jgi:hypothetical protein